MGFGLRAPSSALACLKPRARRLKPTPMRSIVTSPHPNQPFAAREEAEERAIEGLRGLDQCVVDPLLRELLLQSRRVLLDHPAVLGAERVGHHRNLLAALEVLEARGV